MVNKEANLYEIWERWQTLETFNRPQTDLRFSIKNYRLLHY